MEKANNFFFLDGVSSSVVCDFCRDGGKLKLTFCHEGDVEKEDCLKIYVRTEFHFDSQTLQTVKSYRVSYALITWNKTLKQSESYPISFPADVWGIVVAIVNDVFPL